MFFFFFFSSRRRHTRWPRDWSSDVCSSDLDDLTQALKDADSEPDEDKRVEMIQEINRQIAEDYLPGLPLSHSPPAIVVSSEVQGLITSPLAAEDFSTVTLGG